MSVLWKRKSKSAFRRSDRSFTGRAVSKIKSLLSTKVVIFIAIPFLLVVLSAFLVKYMASDKFKVTEINYYGAKLTQISSLESIDREITGQSIFLVPTRKVEKLIKDRGSYIEEVYVEKSLPSTLEVHIVEKDPKLVYINFSNAYLIDKDFKVIDVLSERHDFSLKEEEIKIIRGYGNPDSKDVIDRILADREDVNDENRQEIIDSITLQEKNLIITKIRIELNAAIEASFQKHIDPVAKSRFWHLPVQFAYETQDLDIGDEVDKDRSEMFVEIEDFFSQDPDFPIARYVWESDFKFAVKLTTGQTIYFSPKRSVDIQKEDLILVINRIRSEGSNYRTIDLSADKIVVEK